MPPSSATRVELQRLTAADTELIAQFEGWAANATTEQGAERCKSILAHLKLPTPPDYEVNYGVFVNQQLVGGVHTSGEYFNVMWIHWDTTRKRVGPEAAYAVLSAQIQLYSKAVVNQPNKKMCKALLRIMSPQRKQGVTCHDDIGSMTFVLGDLQPIQEPSPSVHRPG